MRKTPIYWVSRVPSYFIILTLMLSEFSLGTEDTANISHQQVQHWPANDWILKPEQDLIPACNISEPDCLCQGGYIEPPRIDLELSSNDPDALFAAANSYSVNEAGVAELRGNVVIQQQDIQVESDKVILDSKNSLATIKGKVRFRQTDFLLLGEQAVVNLESKDATFSKAEYITHSKGIRGNAEIIEITGDGGLSITQGSYTSCGPNDNSWRVQGSNISLDQNSGWGTAKHMTLRVHDIPVFYSPYFRFPIDDTRHTGFLYPSFNLNKPDLAAPYYINIAPNYDATITPRRIGHRGEMLEGQFRYLTHKTGLGILDFGYLPNDGDFDYQDRKLVDWTQSSRWNDNWSAEIDMHYASDKEYFTDFDSDFSIQSISHLDRKAALYYEDDNWGFSTKIHSYQTFPGIAPQYRRLPEIDLNSDHIIAGQAGSASQLHWLNKMEYVYFEQQLDTTVPSAHRISINTAIEWRLQFPWGHFIPASRFQHTHYRLAGESNINNKERDISSPITSLDGGLIFERSFSLRGDNWLQTLEPRLFYVNIPYQVQSDVPLFNTDSTDFSYGQLFRENRFAGGDRLGDTEQVSLGLSSRLINADNGQEILRASAGQIFYLKDRQVQLAEGSTEISTLERSAIALELSAQINEKLQLSGGTVWDEEINTLESANFTADYEAHEKRRWNFGYQYRVDSGSGDRIAQSKIGFAQKLNSKWTLIGLWHFDLENNTTIEQLTGLTYESCCWNNSIVYRRKITGTTDNTQESDYGIFFQVELKGLTGFEVEI